MEDIRTYLDSTDGSYHKGETGAFAAFAGVSLLAIGVFWTLQGGWFLLKYGAAFSDAAGILSVDAPPASTCWVIASLRLLMGLFLGWLGLLAWDQRRSFLHWLWVTTPVYVWYWGSWFWQLDPDHRAAEVTLNRIATHPNGFLVLLSIVLMVTVFVGSFLQSWAFRAAREDFHPGVILVITGIVVGGLHFYLEKVPLSVRATGMVYGITPLDGAASGYGILKLIALTEDELDCHENMDELTAGLRRVEQLGRKIMYKAFADRPGGERLVRMVQQMAGVDSDLTCPEGGWYRVDRETGVWHCSVHGDLLPKTERQLQVPSPGGDQDAGGDFGGHPETGGDFDSDF